MELVDGVMKGVQGRATLCSHCLWFCLTSLDPQPAVAKLGYSTWYVLKVVLPSSSMYYLPSVPHDDGMPLALTNLPQDILILICLHLLVEDVLALMQVI